MFPDTGSMDELQSVPENLSVATELHLDYGSSVIIQHEEYMNTEVRRLNPRKEFPL